jgi:hypothetical protein
MKRLEGEVLEMIEQLGGSKDRAFELTELTVDPHQFLGIEINPRAAAIAEMVLWIGYLQWHFRTHGDTLPREPVLHAYRNIECRDAVLAYDRTEPLLDDAGRPVTRWDGRTMKKHPVTREDVPDETARVPVLRYINPQKAEWPEAEYIVGNPPFIGGWRIRQALGDGYVQALWTTYPDIPEKADYVMYWWDTAARLTREGIYKRFGFITTNSITQVFQWRVVSSHIDADRDPLRIVFAVADHPWVDDSTAAAVRVAFTSGEGCRTRGQSNPQLGEVAYEDGDPDTATITLRNVPLIGAKLGPGARVDQSIPLHANLELCSAGVQLYGSGFILSEEEVAQWRNMSDWQQLLEVVHPYLNGRDLMGSSRGAFVIDFFGYDKAEAATRFPRAYQRVLDRVKPERDLNRRAPIREKWWRFGWERPNWRQAMAGLSRFISTPETAKHRVFVFLDGRTLPDNMLNNFAVDDAYFLGVLSSRIHVTWALAAGGRLGVGNDPRYNKTRCFDPFPFPEATESQKERIRTLAEQLDAHRKRQQSLHPKLTITDMYNVLEKLRSGEELTAKERLIHEQGLVSVLKQIHDELDATVFDAYSWPATLTDEEILEQLVALNAERAAEERAGTIRWLRPEYQNPKGTATQTTMVIEEEVETAVAIAPAAKAAKVAWPKPLKEQLQAVRSALAAQATASTADQVAKTFKGARVDRVAEILDSLSALGQVREVEEGRFVV